MKNINTVPYWDSKHTREYDNRSMLRPRREYQQFIIDRVANDGRLVDVGCGNGLFIESLLPVKKNLNVYGIDFSQSACELNRKKLKRANFYNFDFMKELGEYKYLKDSFNYVVCMEVLEHITDYKKALKLLVDLCRPNGTVFITIPNQKAIKSEEHVHYFTSKEMRGAIEEVGEKIDYFVVRTADNKHARNLAFSFIPKNKGVKL